MWGLKATSHDLSSEEWALARRFYNDLSGRQLQPGKKSSVFRIWKRETEVSLSMIDNNIIL